MRATYTKLKSGAWGIRAESEAIRNGDQIIVTKKDGSTKIEIVEAVVWRGNGVSVCAIGAMASSGYSYRASNAAPRGRVCPECGSRECSKAWNPRDLCDED